MNRLILLSVFSFLLSGMANAQYNRYNQNDYPQNNGRYNNNNWDDVYQQNNGGYNNNPYNDPNYYPYPPSGQCAPPPPPPPPVYRRPVVVVPPSFCAPVVIAPRPYYSGYYRPRYYGGYGHHGGYGRGRRW